MPNWCETTIEISLSEKLPLKEKAKAVKQFNEFIKKLAEGKEKGEYENFLNVFFPIPEELLITSGSSTEKGQQAIDNIAKYGCKDWYDWGVRNWGTKWDLDILDVVIDGYSITITSMTAWTPPIAGVTKISEDYPYLHFKVDYAEPGVGFQGVAEIENGDCDDNCEDYDCTRECEGCCACDEDCENGCPYGVQPQDYPEECPCRKNKEE